MQRTASSSSYNIRRVHINVAPIVDIGPCKYDMLQNILMKRHREHNIKKKPTTTTTKSHLPDNFITNIKFILFICSSQHSIHLCFVNMFYRGENQQKKMCHINDNIKLRQNGDNMHIHSLNRFVLLARYLHQHSHQLLWLMSSIRF